MTRASRWGAASSGEHRGASSLPVSLTPASYPRRQVQWRALYAQPSMLPHTVFPQYGRVRSGNRPALKLPGASRCQTRHRHDRELRQIQSSCNPLSLIGYLPAKSCKRLLSDQQGRRKSPLIHEAERRGAGNCAITLPFEG
jgi:hypothetical protein